MITWLVNNVKCDSIGLLREEKGVSPGKQNLIFDIDFLDTIFFVF